MLYEGHTLQGARTKMVYFCSAPMAGSYAAVDTQILDQGITTFQNNKNMNDRESFGAIGVLTSAADTIKRVKDAKIIR